MHELRSDALMISMNDVHHFIDIYEKENLQRLTLIDVKQENIKDILCQKYQHSFQFVCYQAVYTKKEKVDIICPKNVTIQLLDQSYLSLVCDKYHYVNSHDLQKKMEKGHLWGLFEDHQIAGFIGIHDEGSMGLLEILPQYHRKGYGYLLEGYLINEYLDRGWIPYCQVVENNEASLHLQKKLKMTLSKQLSYWLF